MKVLQEITRTDETVQKSRIKVKKQRRKKNSEKGGECEIEIDLFLFLKPKMEGTVRLYYQNRRNEERE